MSWHLAGNYSFSSFQQRTLSDSCYRTHFLPAALGVHFLATMADPAAEEQAHHGGELCCECGQFHLLPDNHLYNFQNEVDDELICHICLQPLLQPMDTPCGHTYCFKCLENFMQEYNFCPMDRKKLSLQQCHKSSLLVRNLLDKLVVICPFKAECQQTMQRCELEAHLQNRCFPIYLALSRCM